MALNTPELQQLYNEPYIDRLVDCFKQATDYYRETTSRNS